MVCWNSTQKVQILSTVFHEVGNFGVDRDSGVDRMLILMDRLG